VQVKLKEQMNYPSSVTFRNSDEIPSLQPTTPNERIRVWPPFFIFRSLTEEGYTHSPKTIPGKVLRERFGLWRLG